MKNKGRDYSQLLIVAALLVTLPRFAGAFIAADMTTIPDWVSTALSVGMGISGLGMGILDVLGVAYVFDGWRRSMPGNGKPWPFRYKILTGFVAALFVVGIGILSPFTVSRMRGHTMSVTLPGFLGWLWSVLVIASPYLLIGGIVTGQSGIVTVNHETSTQPKATDMQPQVAEGNRPRILALHVENPGMTHKSIAEAVGVSRQYVDKVLAHSNGKAR